MSGSEKMPVEVAIIPIEEEQILAEREIIRKLSKQSQIGKVFSIYSNSENELTQSGHKHHDHHKHESRHKHNEDYKINYEKNGHEEEFKKYVGRARNEKLDPNGPKDKYNLVRIMFFVLGLIHVLPLTFFVTANEYWMYKFRNTSIINSTDANDRTYLQKNFQSLNQLISMGPSTICQFLLTFFGHKIRTKTRIMTTLALHSFVFVLQTIFVEIDTDEWQVEFYVITVCAMTVISCSMNLGGTGNMVTISQFPDQYLKVYLIGEGVASLVTAIMRLISIVAAPSTLDSALMYFVTGSTLMIVPAIVFYFSTHLAFFRYYTQNMKQSTRKRIPRLPEFKEIISYTWPLLILQVISAFMPHASVGNLVVSEYYGTDSVWGTKYFVTCCTYLLPAVCGIIGRALFYKFEYNSSIKLLYFITFAREVVYVPLMLFVNAKPRQHLPVLLPHDWQYALIVGSQALLMGYSSNMSSMKSLRMVPKEKLELSWLVTLFIIKIAQVASSPMGFITVNNLL